MAEYSAFNRVVVGSSPTGPTIKLTHSQNFYVKGSLKMDVENLLIKARELLGKGFCKDCQAKDSNGNMVPYFSPLASSFCMLGALNRVLYNNEKYSDHDITISTHTKAINILYDVLDSPCISSFNDSANTTQENVLACMDRAILLCKTGSVK